MAKSHSLRLVVRDGWLSVESKCKQYGQAPIPLPPLSLFPPTQSRLLNLFLHATANAIQAELKLANDKAIRRAIIHWDKHEKIRVIGHNTKLIILILGPYSAVGCGSGSCCGDALVGLFVATFKEGKLCVLGGTGTRDEKVDIRPIVRFLLAKLSLHVIDILANELVLLALEDDQVYLALNSTRVELYHLGVDSSRSRIPPQQSEVVFDNWSSRDDYNPIPTIPDRKFTHTSIPVGTLIQDAPVTPKKRKRGEASQSNPARIKGAVRRRYHPLRHNTDVIVALAQNRVIDFAKEGTSRAPFIASGNHVSGRVLPLQLASDCISAISHDLAEIADECIQQRGDMLPTRM
ncbi:hypothetical protein NM208_g8023 [Fusarium decemcellulare]|uniref:Uncharacterized protein n=1 Tax=Fusarium decemcellulare TaxID=57161 RepID=A0ACC1S724_9HYPO|nr:hypothetical protein NM208_g8023 [Fusarium decemcellulare]